MWNARDRQAIGGGEGLHLRYARRGWRELPARDGRQTALRSWLRRFDWVPSIVHGRSLSLGLAEGAVLIETDHVGIEKVWARICKLVQERGIGCVSTTSQTGR